MKNNITGIELSFHAAYLGKEDRWLVDVYRGARRESSSFYNTLGEAVTAIKKAHMEMKLHERHYPGVY